MSTIIKAKNRKPSPVSKKSKEAARKEMLLQRAFNNSLQPNLLTTVKTGKIILANRAACKLLGYSKKELSSKFRSTIFNIKESNFKKMLKERREDGHSKAFVTAIKKSGKPLSCEITSAVFLDTEGNKLSINTIENISHNILEQKNIDIKKQKIVAADILVAQAKSDSRLEQEVTLKERQITEATEQAKETERTDIGKELHDNVNQLLGASKLYLDMAKGGGEGSQVFLKRSSEYTRMAIEEIRILTKGLTTDTIKNLGLCTAIENLSEATMEVSPLSINLTLKSFKEKSVDHKFKLNIFRIIQEQMNNIIKHAAASEVSINLVQNTKYITLSISDNGVGFDITKKGKGIGIANIKSRAASFNGTADFVSQPGQGCVLSVTFPFKKMTVKS